jgi:hypothetical protein
LRGAKLQRLGQNAKGNLLKKTFSAYIIDVKLLILQAECAARR